MGMTYVNKAGFIMTHMFSTNSQCDSQKSTVQNCFAQCIINHQELEVRIKLNNLTNGIK